MKRTGTSQSAAQCMKWRAGLCALGFPVLAHAQAGLSVEAQDPWMALASPVEGDAGAAAVPHHAPLSLESAMWVGGRRLFGLQQLQSHALALSSPGPGGRWGVSIHQLEAEIWREHQVLVRWAPGRPDNSKACDSSIGLEWRRQVAALDGWENSALWLHSDLAWQAGALRLGVGGAASQPMAHAALETHLSLGCSLPLGVALCWQSTRSTGRRDERASLVWRHPRGGMAVGWREGRGWEVGAQVKWRGLLLGVSWWNHPVLPPTSSWGMAWRKQP